MTTVRTSLLPRSRRAAVAVLVGAGVALIPVPALASAPAGVAVAAAPAAAPNAAAQTAVDTALAHLGAPYVWAGTGPGAFDCSGLTQFAYRAAGISVPHSSRLQSTLGVPVSRADLRPGDLVFFYSPVSHVGMYIGHGQMVHAPTTGSVVKVVSLDAMGGFTTARRLT